MGMTQSAATGSGYLDALLDRVEGALADDLVPVEIFNDEQIFKAEMERVFGTTGVFVAHESEIPEPNDFVMRRIGLDKVIVTRDGAGGIHVLSNYCRHRGAEVCQSDKGNAGHFTCPYHGWAYKNTGDFAGAPQMERAYGETFYRERWGLYKAAKVESFHGFIFASLSQDVPPLRQFLGGAGWMLEATVGLHPDGMRVVAPPERYKIRGDWKTAAENFAGDVYHVGHAHWSTEEIGVSIGLAGTCEGGRGYEFENGHGFIGHEWTSMIHPGFVFWGYDEATIAKFDFSRLDPVQIETIKHKPPTVGTIFPNLSMIRFNASTKLDEPPMVITSFRQWQPTGPGEFELWNWQFVWRFQSEEEARRAYDIGQFTFGSAGIFETDDTVLWEGAAKAGKSAWMRRAGMQLHFQQGRMSAVDDSPDPNWRGPGVHRLTGFGEHRQKNFYRHWLKVMRDGGAEARRGEV